MHTVSRRALLSRAVALPMMILAGCAGSTTAVVQPPDPAIVADITNVCLASGLFEIGDGVVATLVPVTALPIALVNAGVDKVCANPAAFASDISTVQWLVSNLIGGSPVAARNLGVGRVRR